MSICLSGLLGISCLAFVGSIRITEKLIGFSELLRNVTFYPKMKLVISLVKILNS